MVKNTPDSGEAVKYNPDCCEAVKADTNLSPVSKVSVTAV